MQSCRSLRSLEAAEEVGVAQKHAPLRALCFVLLCHLIGRVYVMPAHIAPLQGRILGSARSKTIDRYHSGNSVKL